MKKHFTLFLTVILTVTAFFSLSACKIEQKSQAQIDYEKHLYTDKEKFVFYLNDDGTAELIAYQGNNTELTVPTTADGHTVTTIAMSAFAGEDFLIEYQKRVTDYMESTRGQISVNSNVNAIIVNENQIISGTISIGTSAVNNNGSVSYGINNGEYILPAQSNSYMSVTSTFDKPSTTCYPTKITLPDTITSIELFAFGGCTSLQSVYIGKGVTNIGDGSFAGCSNLTSLTVADGNKVYHSAGNCLIKTADKTMIAGCNTSIIPADDSVTAISNGAFYGFSNLTHITIPENITNIDGDTFYGCEKLFQKENGVSYVDKWAIAGDPATVNAALRSNTVGIGGGAFSNLKSLINITIPNSVKYIGSGAFRGCESLADIVIPNSVTSISKSAFSGCSSLTSITIPNGITGIGESVFSGCSSLTGITIPDSVTSISKSAFSGCSSLTSIVIPNSVTSIGNSAFERCASLTSIVIPDSVTSIGDSVFYHCYSLKDITIGNGIITIGSGAFYRGKEVFNDLTYTIHNGEKYLGNETNPYVVLMSVSDTSITSFTIPESTKIIYDSAFVRCESLESVVIPNTVTSIGSYAFSICDSLTSITFQGTKAEWEAITKSSNWNSGTGSYTIHCTDGDITK